jgi:uncharacterized protein (UPF0335 family)
MAELGHNSVSAEMLRGYVERFENIKSQKDELSDDQKAIMAEAKSNGFVPKAIRHIVKLRAMKPSDLMESEALIGTYRGAMGMADDLPLFRHVGLMGVDIAKRDEVIEALKQLVPHNGSIQVETADGKPVRLTRDKDGNVTMQEILLPSAPSEAKPGRSAAPAVNKADIPAVDEAGAEALGREAFGSDIPIIKNPFPFGDPRRQRWDRGWRAASGGDGMGPQDKDEK